MPIKLYICPECHNANETPGICCERVSGSHQRVVRSQRARDIENLRITIKVLEREDREIELATARFFLRELKENMTDKEMLRKRERMAEAAGEGAWRNRASGEWCQVDVAFYPTQKLWITEKGERREVTRAELEKNYDTLKL